MRLNVLVLNAGSSSLKFQLIAVGTDGSMGSDGAARLCKGSIDHFGTAATFVCTVAAEKHEANESIPDIHTGVERVFRWINDHPDLPQVQAVGHRVVHGGSRFAESAAIDDEVLEGIRACVGLAPLHNPSNIEGIEAVRKHLGPDMPQVAVFDTAFHQSMPEHAYLYALPREWYEKHGVRRYGFHGTSHRYVAQRYGEITGRTSAQTTIITVHLGNGCSAAAIRYGKSVDTSMGMTPLEGLMMGTRCGDIDPSIVSYIATQENIPCGEVERDLNEHSGLRGLSGISSDMRELEASSSDGAKLAIQVFCYRVRKYIGSYLAALGGADAVVFTGGIGEHSPATRANVCEGLAWAGLTLDALANESNSLRISTAESKLAAFCIPTDEELLIARDTAGCVIKKRSPEIP